MKNFWAVINKSAFGLQFNPILVPHFINKLIKCFIKVKFGFKNL